jgi:hypothetical protein
LFPRRKDYPVSRLLPRPGWLVVSLIAGVLCGLVVAAPAAGAVSTVAVDPGRVSLAGSGYHGHSVFETNDVHVFTDDTSDASYATGRFPVSVPLAQAGTPALTLSGTGTTPSMRLDIDFDGDGLIDGTLVGDASYLPDWWLTPDSQQFVKNAAPQTGSGSGSPWHGTLGKWSQVFRHAVILRAGYSIGPDAVSDWRIASLSVGSTTYDFTSTVPNATVLHAPDLDATLAHDGSAGHIFFDPQSLRVYTDNTTAQAYVTQYFDAPGGSVPLGTLGQPALRWLGDGLAPRPQLMVDFTGDGQSDAVLTANPNAADNWYVTATAPQSVKNRAPSCSFAATCAPTITNWNGSLSGWSDQFPAAQALAIGFSLGPGEKADGDIQNLVAGSTSYTFANTPPTATPRRLSTAFQTQATIDLSTGVTDPDPGETMTYYVSTGHHGTVTLDGSIATYVPNAGFAGKDSFLYIADDGVTQAAQALVHVTVRKARSTLRLRFRPRTPTPKQVPVATVTVSSAGAVNGGTVTVKVGRFSRTATVANGKATLRLRRLAAGDHAVHASFSGTSTAGTARITRTLHVS